MRVIIRKKERNVENVFFYMTECVFIFKHFNTNVIMALTVMNNIRKEMIMIVAHYGNQITTSQSIISIIISNNDSNHIIIFSIRNKW